MGIPRGLRDFQAGWKSRFLTFPSSVFSTPRRAAIFLLPAIACHPVIFFAFAREIGRVLFSEQDMKKCVKRRARILRGWVSDIS